MNANTTYSTRYDDGTTMGDMATAKLERLVQEVSDAQAAIDLLEESRQYVPQYLIDLYQDSVDSLETYASYWGFEC